jgi:cyclic pyranopterin phosphate synthase
MTVDKKPFPHLSEAGAARMTDISGKEITRRVAIATGVVVMKPETLAAIVTGGRPKGDVLAVARLAGIMGAKRTGIDLIPLCQPVTLDSVSVEFEPMPPDQLRITAKAILTGRSGVEMEAMTAVSLAALTVYDMCKAGDKDITITDIFLTDKTGGRSGDYHRSLATQASYSS